MKKKMVMFCINCICLQVTVSLLIKCYMYPCVSCNTHGRNVLVNGMRGCGWKAQRLPLEIPMRDWIPRPCPADDNRVCSVGYYKVQTAS